MKSASRQFWIRWLLAGVATAPLALAGQAQGQEQDRAKEQAQDAGSGEIVVYAGARDARALLETPNAVTIVDQDEIDRRQASTFEELLGDAPGVLIFGGPRGIAQEPNIRGFSDDQIVIRLDGMRQNFNVAHRGRFFIDPAALKRVEILRGGASTLYGSGALGGVIALETKDAADVVAPGQDVGAELRVGYNSQGDELISSATAAGFLGDVEALGFVSYRPMSSDLTDGDGQDIAMSNIDTQSALAKLGFTPSDALRIEASYQIYQDDGKTPPNADAAITATNTVERDIVNQQGRVALEYRPLGSDLVDLEAIAYVVDHDLSEHRISDGRLDETQTRTYGLELTNRSRFDFGAPVQLSYGLEMFEDSQEATRNGAARPQSPDATRRFAAGFVQADIGLGGGVTLVPGLRYDYFELEPETRFESRSEDEVSPRIALNWRPTPDWQLYGSAAQSFRAPSLTELYADGVHFPVFGPFNNVFVPAPNLRPEVSRQLEIGARYLKQDIAEPGDRVSFSANAYAANVEDFIDQTVVMDFTGFVFETRTENVDAELWGFEAEARYETPRWHLGTGLTIARGREQNGGALGSIPGDKLTFDAGFKPIEELTLGARASFVDGQDDVPTDGTATPGYSVFDLYASFQPIESVRLNVGVDNVADRVYRIHPNALNQAGRAFKITGAIKF